MDVSEMVSVTPELPQKLRNSPCPERFFVLRCSSGNMISSASSLSWSWAYWTIHTKYGQYNSDPKIMAETHTETHTEYRFMDYQLDPPVRISPVRDEVPQKRNRVT